MTSELGPAEVGDVGDVTLVFFYAINYQFLVAPCVHKLI